MARNGPNELPAEPIERRIREIRGQKVLLDKDLALLYGVETRVLVQAVKRNLRRFPSDFMFQLTWEETSSLRSQIVILNDQGQRGQAAVSGRGRHIKYPPYAFTEQGVAMLSTVLRSDRAIEVNIQIMRVFVRLRQIVASHRGLAEKLAELERRIGSHDEAIRTLFNAIRHLMVPARPKRRQIGFHARNDE